MKTINVSVEYLDLLTRFQIIDDLSKLSSLFKDACELINMDRIILYKEKTKTKVEIISYFSTLIDDSFKVGDIHCIDRNINLYNAFKEKEISKIPVEGEGEDIAIPIYEKYILTADDINEAREIDDIDNSLLIHIANSIENALRIRQLIIKNSKDALTNILNRGALDIHIRSNLSPFEKEYPKAKGCAFIDIDNFGLFNKNYGHKVGDIVLKEVCKIIETIIGSNGIVYRYGGEEIVIFFFKGNIVNISQKIREIIEIKKFFFEKKYFNVTLSIGVSIVSDLKKSITSSNHALLYAKEHGRNQVQVYSYNIADWFDKK